MAHPGHADQQVHTKERGINMRTLQKLSKFAAVLMVAGGLALTGTTAAVAQENPVQKKAATLACGSDVFLDGLRALAVGENGRHEVYIMNGLNKIWPETASYVSMAPGQRVEVDKCVAKGAQLRLLEVDDFDSDLIGGQTINGDVTRDYEFCCGDGGRYRLGAIA